MCTGELCPREEQPRKQDSCWSNVVCLCATLSQAFIMGIAQGSFGVFLPVIMEEFNCSRGETAWIGSLAIGLSYFASPVAARLSERFGCRIVTIFGGFACALSLAITSLAKTVLHVAFSYGLMFGLGASCVRTSTFLVAAKYFYRRRSFATGLISSGPGIGMFVYGPLVQQLLTLIGLHNTYRALAGFPLLVCFLAGSFSPNVENEKEEDIYRTKTNQKGQDIHEKHASFNWRRVLNRSIWKTPVFTVITIACTVTSLGDFVPLIHLVKHCKELGIPGDSASRLLMYFGLASFTGRIVIGRLGDCKCFMSSLYVVQIGFFTMAVSFLLLPSARGYTAFVVFSVVYGFSDGAVGSQLNLLLLTSVSPNLRAVAFGYATCLISFTMMTGLSVAGVIADKLGSYVPAFYVAGSEVFLGAGITTLVFCFKSPPHPTDEADSQVVSLKTIQRRNSEEINVECKTTVCVVVELHQGNHAEQISVFPFVHGSFSSLEDKCTDV